MWKHSQQSGRLGYVATLRQSDDIVFKIFYGACPDWITTCIILNAEVQVWQHSGHRLFWIKFSYWAPGYDLFFLLNFVPPGSARVITKEKSY